MRVLVTNDDGVFAPGLLELVAVLSAEFPDTMVVAPAADYSGAGTSINHTGGLGPQRVRLPGLDHIAAHSVNGPPAVAVLAAFTGACGPLPDVVVSGINSGPNIGVGILHSGTVGAALTAASLGVPALAVSLDNHWHLMDSERESVEAAPRQRHWRTAAETARRMLPALRSGGEAVVLNVNVPDVPAADLRDQRFAAIAPVGVLGLVELDAGAVLDMRPSTANLPDGRATDAGLLADGHVTMTALRLTETSLHQVITGETDAESRDPAAVGARGPV